MSPEVTATKRTAHDRRRDDSLRFSQLFTVCKDVVDREEPDVPGPIPSTRTSGRPITTTVVDSRALAQSARRRYMGPIAAHDHDSEIPAAPSRADRLVSASPPRLDPGQNFVDAIESRALGKRGEFVSFRTDQQQIDQHPPESNRRGGTEITAASVRGSLPASISNDSGTECPARGGIVVEVVVVFLRSRSAQSSPRPTSIRRGESPDAKGRLPMYWAYSQPSDDRGLLVFSATHVVLRDPKPE